MEMNYGNSTDRDRRMMRSFEPFPDAREQHDDKEAKKRKKKKSSNESATAASKEATEETKDKVPEKKKESTLDQLFERKTETQSESEDKLETEDQLEELPAEADPERLTDDERREAARQIVGEEQAVAAEAQQTARKNSPEEQEVLAQAVLLDNLNEELDKAADVDEALEDATIRTEAELDLTEPVQGEASTGGRGETGEDVQDEELSATTLPRQQAPPPAASGSDSDVVPPPPLRPGSPLPGGFNPDRPFKSNLPLEAEPAAHFPDRRERYSRPRRGADILLGGIVGYLLGRRRGRINTEKRLIPVQEKLEKEVKELHSKILTKEEHIRQLAAQKVAKDPEHTAAQIIERVQAKPAFSARETATPLRVTGAERPQAESKPVSQPETAAPVFEQPAPERIHDRQVEERDVNVMTVPELLQVARKIDFEGVSAEWMYRQNRLDVRGLRRVVKEYLLGDRLERVLREELQPVKIERVQSQEFLGRAAAARSSDIALVGDAGSAQQQHPARAYQQVTSPSPQAGRPVPSAGIYAPRRWRQSKTVAIVAVALGTGLALLLLIL